MRATLALLLLLAAAVSLFTISGDNPAQAQPAPTATTDIYSATFVPQATRLAGTSPVTLLHTLEHGGQTVYAQYDSTYTQVVTWGDDGYARLWDAETGAMLLELPHGLPVVGVTFNADQTRLFTYSESECETCTFQATQWNIDAASPDYGRNLFTVVQSDRPELVPTAGVALSPDETLFATWANDQHIHLWDTTTGEQVARLQHGSVVWGVSWNRSGTLLLSWSTDESARVWDVAAAMDDPFESRVGYYRHNDVVWGARWSPDESQVLTWGLDGRAVLWDLATGRPLNIMQSSEFMWAAAWGGPNQSDATTVYTATLLGDLSRWNLRYAATDRYGQTIDPVWTIDGLESVSSVVPSPDGRALAVRLPNTIGLIDTQRGERITEIDAADARFAAWSPGGRYLLTHGNSGFAFVFGGTGGERLAVLAHETAVRSAEWGKAEDRILTASDDGTARIWALDLTAPGSDPAPTPDYLVTPTLTPIPAEMMATQLAQTQSVATNTPRPTATPVRGLPVASEWAQGQSFIPQTDTLRTVDVWLRARDAGLRGGDELTLTVIAPDGSPIASATQFIPAAFDGWVRFELEGGVRVQAGFSHELRLTAAIATRNMPYFGWAYQQNRVPDGILLNESVYFVFWDFFYEINADDVVATLPPVTLTPSPTATPLPPPLTATAEAEWRRLSIYATRDPRADFGSVEVPLGQPATLILGYVECCYFINAYSGPVTWSVAPSEGATIDPNTGEFIASAAGIYTITADGPLREPHIDTVFVYDPEEQPLVGFWYEVDAYDCATDTWFVRDDRFRELIFTADGRYFLTIFPFEVYVDYGGSYEVNGPDLSMFPSMINYLPPDVTDAYGTYEFDADGRLTVCDIWLGSMDSPGADSYCALRFQRYNFDQP